MQRYFISESDFENRKITSDDVFHIRTVMRNKVNDEIVVCYDSKAYLAKITSITNDEVAYEILSIENGNHELPFFITIFQGYPKADKLEDIIKHGTELGASEFVPTLMKRSVFKLEEKKKASKLERFNKIAKEASEQSYRNNVPKVSDILNLKAINFDSYDVKIVCFEETAKNGEQTAFKTAIKSLTPGMRVAIVVGPEGGIDDSEINYLKDKGFIVAGLGSRILRTETVVFYTLSAIAYEWELKNE